MPQKLVNAMFEEQKGVRQMIHLRGRESSPYYIFLHSDDESSTEEDGISLQTIKSVSLRYHKIEVINVQIKPEDTLQALALRYRCTISSENQDNVNTTSEQCQEETSTKQEEQLIDLGTASTSTECSNTEINTIILNSVCEPLSSYNSANIPEISHTEHDTLLNETESTERVETCETDIFKCSGDNWGLSWTQLLVFSLLLSFAGPIIYILYIAEYSNKANVTVSN
ncbi:uncharacterized protein LOC105433251 isoform X2 [Pogonomyrmex barbatus]|uniref:Uncharacterized protein LOC105433251 isoform X2 n=1 Tax=Pogonomyrmex barbatus TaxID=144034 RepID=A0A6I9WTZ7_9HYME|nr:uncharacterized protein LOC105433251 isoform X2 [Pogonomyrmex barbatus]